MATSTILITHQPLEWKPTADCFAVYGIGRLHDQSDVAKLAPKTASRLPKLETIYRVNWSQPECWMAARTGAGNQCYKELGDHKTLEAAAAACEQDWQQHGPGWAELETIAARAEVQDYKNQKLAANQIEAFLTRQREYGHTIDADAATDDTEATPAALIPTGAFLSPQTAMQWAASLRRSLTQAGNDTIAATSVRNIASQLEGYADAHASC